MNKLPFKRLLNGNILIKPDPVEKITKNGIIIPAIAQNETKTGTVILASESTKRNPVSVKAGDRVKYAHHGIAPFEFGGEKYYMVKQDRLFCILIDEDEN